MSSSATSVIRKIGYLASIHDLGKAHPLFQQKDPICKKRLEECDPDLFSEMYGNSGKGFRHEYYTAEIMKRIWHSQGYGRDEAQLWGRVLSLHHQKPQPKNSVMLRDPRNKAWLDTQQALELKLRERFLGQETLHFPTNTDATCILITAILILADWVSSSEPFAHAEELSYEQIDELAERTLRNYGLISDDIFPTVPSFQALFPFIHAPRPLQQACSNLSAEALLTIIEAPMGEGKSEAAFFLASQQCRAYRKRGIYMALPSQATSNQMFGRMDAMLRSLSCDTPRLLHSTAFLNEDTPDRFNTEDEAAAAKWTRPMRMGLLTPDAVGTVDQAMAAVLWSKFSLIRLAGLSSKVLIIDEIHAYDMYMSQIIETLLRWCCALKVPVILLSATMQSGQKKRYIDCFGAEATLLEEYPLLTQVLPDHRVLQLPAEAAAHYVYTFSPFRTEDDVQLVHEALELVSDGGCLAILMNTVSAAQQIFQILLREKNTGTQAVLFHSRFSISRRMEIEQECLQAFGKDRSHRPRKAILVATQVVEQSLDLDFDGMISELAPVDLLLQRAGRLHRHRGNVRPEKLRNAVMQVLLPGGSAPAVLEKRYGRSSYVYEPFLLFNTEQKLSAEQTVSVPEGIRPLIEEVYSSVTEASRDAWMKRNMKGLLQTAQAKGCTWPTPEEDSFFPDEQSTYFDVVDTDDGYSSTSEAATRLGNDSIRIMFCTDEDYSLLNADDLDRDTVKKLYLSSASIQLHDSDLEGNENALRISKGKLSGIWALRGTQEVNLNTGILHNDPVLGISWEAKK